jgi:hypothetical protein
MSDATPLVSGIAHVDQLRGGSVDATRTRRRWLPLALTLSLSPRSYTKLSQLNAKKESEAPVMRLNLSSPVEARQLYELLRYSESMFRALEAFQGEGRWVPISPPPATPVHEVAHWRGLPTMQRGSPL